MRYLNILILLASIILTWSCQKDDSTQQPKWDLSISIVTDCSATLHWSSDIDTNQVNSYYEIWLNSTLLKRSTNNCDTLKNLIHKTRYFVKIVAIENGVSKYSFENNFITNTNFPPSNLTIEFDSLTSESVILNRSDAKDPERKTLEYEVRVNGILQRINQTDNRFLLKNLKPNTLNTIKLTARDNMNNTVSVSKSMVTPASPNSLLFRYYLYVNGKKRECVLYLPKNYNQSSNLPLLFCFHGAGSYSWDMALFTSFREIADRDNVIIAYPQSSENGLEKHTSWCVDPGYPNDELPFADKLIDNLIENFSINSKRVYSCGFSSGGYMSFYLALMLSDKITAIAPVAGNPHRLNFIKRTITEPLPLLLIYGTIDGGFNGDYESLSVKETLDFWIKNNNCNSTPNITKLPHSSNHSTTITLSEYPNTDFNNRILYYQINEGDHWWPGGQSDITDMHAETVIWDFFKNISRK